MADTDPTTPTPATGTDPAAGTPPATPAPVVDTPPTQPTVDWEARYKAAQAELTKQQMARAEAQREVEALKAEAVQPEPEATGPVRAAARRTSETEAELRKLLAERDLQIARSVYGEETFMAASTAEQLLASAATPADRIGALEAYHAARSRGAVQPPVVAPAAPATPAPVADSNRQEAPAPSEEIQLGLREAVENRDLLGGVKTLLKQFG